jgi:hypothetical protein
MKFIVLIDRDRDDEVLPAGASREARIEQLQREFEPSDVTIRVISHTNIVDERDAFLVEIEHPGPMSDLRDLLQDNAFDTWSVDGFFDIVATVDGHISSVREG